MDGPSDLLVMLMLFVGLFLNWIKAVISALIAILIRRRRPSLAIAVLIGAVEGLVGSNLELLDLYLTRDGWAAIDTLALITIVLSALASLVWWIVARLLYALLRRVMGGG